MTVGDIVSVILNSSSAYVSYQPSAGTVIMISSFDAYVFAGSAYHTKYNGADRNAVAMWITGTPPPPEVASANNLKFFIDNTNYYQGYGTLTVGFTGIEYQ